MEAIRDSVDCNLYFFGDKVELKMMYIILTISLVILAGIYVAMTALASLKPPLLVKKEV